LLVATVVFASGGCSSLLYHPTNTTPEHVANGVWQPQTLETRDAETLRGVVARPQRDTAPWILFFGGNGSSLAGSATFLAQLRGSRDWGLAVFAYRGYDGSSGSPSEEALVRDAVSVASLLERDHDVAHDQLVVVGL